MDRREPRDDILAIDELAEEVSSLGRSIEDASRLLAFAILAQQIGTVEASVALDRYFPR
jgi:hypothetical protein